MSTAAVMRPELSKRNPYWIEKFRYYELKYFSLQYPIWKKALDSITSMVSNRMNPMGRVSILVTDSPVERAFEAMQNYEDKIGLVEKAAYDADPELMDYIIKGVTEGKSYDAMIVDGIPCAKDTYYDRYRKYFYLLSKAKE